MIQEDEGKENDLASVSVGWESIKMDSAIRDSEGKEINFTEVFAGFDRRFDRMEFALGVISERLSVVEYKALKINERLIGIEGAIAGTNERLSSVSTKLWELSKRNEGSAI